MTAKSKGRKRTSDKASSTIKAKAATTAATRTKAMKTKATKAKPTTTKPTTKPTNRAGTKPPSTPSTTQRAGTKAATTRPTTKRAGTKAATTRSTTKRAGTKAATTRPTTSRTVINAASTRPTTKPTTTSSTTTKSTTTKSATTKLTKTKTTTGSKAASTPPSNAASVVDVISTAITMPDWRPALREAVESAGPDFPAFLAAHAPSSGWEHADSPELLGLERWGTELARRDHRAGVGALVRLAQHGLPIILERAGIGLDGMGFKADERSHDGAPVERQVQLAAAWLDAPDHAYLEAVRAGNDPSRQLYIWSEDLRPNDDGAHWWYSDVGQCCGHAITRTSGSADGDGYYQWPPEVCVGRGLVLAVRGLREKGARVRDILTSVRDVLVA